MQEDGWKTQNGRVTQKCCTLPAQSCVTFLCHFAILSLPTVLLHKVSINFYHAGILDLILSSDWFWLQIFSYILMVSHYVQISFEKLKLNNFLHFFRWNWKNTIKWAMISMKYQKPQILLIKFTSLWKESENR